jgi:hypothetical protein
VSIPGGAGRSEAEELLAAWAVISGQRDDLIRAALAAGVSRECIHVLTGIARITIDRIRRAEVPGG